MKDQEGCISRVRSEDKSSSEHGHSKPRAEVSEDEVEKEPHVKNLYLEEETELENSDTQKHSLTCVQRATFILDEVKNRFLPKLDSDEKVGHF